MRRPRPPKAWYQLQELYDRWARVDDWCDNETDAAYRYRSFAFNMSMAVDNLDLRGKVGVRICQRLTEHLQMIDEVRDAYSIAYNDARKLLDSDELMKYAIAIMPFVRAEMAEESKRRLAAMLKKKGIKIRGTDDGGEDASRRDERLPEGDQSEEASDEGAGGGAGPGDRAGEADEDPHSDD